MEKFITSSFEETQKVAEKFARQIMRRKTQASQPGSRQAAVLALSGDLGAGKTTFLQGFAKGLGIEEVVNSPTFVIMKKFEISPRRYALGAKPFCYFYHIDCYRLENPKEILDLGFQEIISNSENIVAIEWPEKISTILPKNITSIKFIHRNSTTRELQIDSQELQ